MAVSSAIAIASIGLCQSDAFQTQRVPPLSYRQDEVRGDELAGVIIPENGPVHVLIDSTGLQLFDAGQWREEKHDTKSRRGWRKLRLAPAADSEHAHWRHSRWTLPSAAPSSIECWHVHAPKCVRCKTTTE
jgi:hypothetical protein